MREYKVPPDNKEEEKIFGAVLSLRQVIWLSVGVTLGVLTVVFLSFILPQAISTFLGIIVGLSGTPFAFLKKGDLTYDKYLLLKYKHDKKKPVLLYKGGNPR